MNDLITLCGDLHKDAQISMYVISLSLVTVLVKRLNKTHGALTDLCFTSYHTSLPHHSTPACVLDNSHWW